MIALIQRVRSASVSVDEQPIACIDQGILALIGFVRNDEARQLDRLLQRILDYRIFPDDDGRMNRSLRDINGQLLLVPQFTLAADTRRGLRPSFSSAAHPETGQTLFDELSRRARSTWPATAFGQFGANMQVALVNDGPVTFWLEV